MKKYLFVAAAAIAIAMSAVMVGCADRDENESFEDWELRNTINGFAWHVDMLKDANGNWTRWEDAIIIYFNVKFSAGNHNFSSEKFYYTEDGISDPLTKEVFNAGDNTAYTIKDAKTILGTVDGDPYFLITLSKKPGSSMEGTLFFYKENRSFEVIMTR